MEESNKNILCIENDKDACDLITFVFQEEGYKVTTCSSAEKGLLQARKGEFGAIILDNRFEDSSGIETCREIRSFDTHIPIIFFSGEARQKEIEKALAVGANAYLIKLKGFEKLIETVINFIGGKAE